MLHLLWFLLIGLAAGWLAGQLFKGHDFGLVNNLIIGVIGAFIGGLLFRLIGLTADGSIGQLITATVGAIALLAILQVVKRRQLI